MVELRIICFELALILLVLLRVEDTIDRIFKIVRWKSGFKEEDNK